MNIGCDTMNKVPEELEIESAYETNLNQSSKKTKKKIDKQLIITIICCTLVLIAFGIYAFKKLSVPEYKVTFNTDGGTSIEAIVVKKNKTITKPQDPTKDDYLFVRWELNEKEYNFNKKITGNITLKAIWEEDISKNVYSVIFDSRGGTSVPTQNVHGNDVATKPDDPTKNHSTFLYWESNGEEYDFNSKVTDDIFITAKWDDEELLTVSFNSNGGTIIKDQQLYKNDLIAKPTDPTKKDYRFIGWTYNGELFNFETPVEKNMILEAKWEKNKTYKVTFDIDGTTTSIEVNEGTRISKPEDPSKEGCTFNGWLLNNTLFDFSSTINSDITLYASWK